MRAHAWRKGTRRDPTARLDADVLRLFAPALRVVRQFGPCCSWIYMNKIKMLLCLKPDHSTSRAPLTIDFLPISKNTSWPRIEFMTLFGTRRQSCMQATDRVATQDSSRLPLAIHAVCMCSCANAHSRSKHQVGVHA